VTLLSETDTEFHKQVSLPRPKKSESYTPADIFSADSPYDTRKTIVES